MPAQGRLDLAWLDAEPVQLDLLVQAAEHLDGAVRPMAGEVAGAEEPRRREHRITMAAPA